MQRTATMPVSRRATGASTIGAMVLAATAKHPGIALRTRLAGGGIARVSYPELGAAAREIAAGLAELGISPGDRVAILSGTRPEWTLADFGILCAGAAVVPIYQTNSAQECEYVLTHSGSRAVFCEDGGQIAKIAAIRDRVPDLEHVIAFEGAGADAMPLVELRALGRAGDLGIADERVAAADPGELATLVYTSGTTGPPKGCMISHASCVAAMRMYEDQLELADRPSVIYLFLPLAHSLARMTQMVAIDGGGTLAYWRGDAGRILEDLADARPTHFPSVPRVFEKLHAAALASLEEQGAVRRALFAWALERGRRRRELERDGRRAGPRLRAEHALADRLVLARVRRLFGGQLELAMTGAAPIGREVLEFFDACGVLILEGYGMTETCAAATLNTASERRFGTVGRPLPGTGVRIADDGEVLMRGPNLFDGYYRDEEATSATLVDGWLHSGDVGTLEEGGFLRITGRKKDLIITSSGKNISPTNIENELRATRWIGEAVVYGDRRPYLVALVTLDAEEAPRLASRLGVPADPRAMAHDPRVRETITAEIGEVNARFARIEQVKRFQILDRELTQAEGELTPTMKVKRAAVYAKHADEIDALYAEV